MMMLMMTATVDAKSPEGTSTSRFEVPQDFVCTFCILLPLPLPLQTWSHPSNPHSRTRPETGKFLSAACRQGSSALTPCSLPQRAPCVNVTHRKRWKQKARGWISAGLGKRGAGSHKLEPLPNVDSRGGAAAGVAVGRVGGRGW